MTRVGNVETMSCYTPCACRDCFEMAIGWTPVLCWECEEAGWTPVLCWECEEAGCDVNGEHDCERPNRYASATEGDEP